MESEGGGQARLASKTMPWAAAPRRGARPAPHVARQRAVLQHEAGVLGALPRLSPAHAARLGVVAGVGQVHHTVPRLQGLGQLVRLRASAGRARVWVRVFFLNPSSHLLIFPVPFLSPPKAIPVLAFYDVRRKDYAELMAHHFATIAHRETRNT